MPHNISLDTGAGWYVLVGCLIKLLFVFLKGMCVDRDPYNRAAMYYEFTRK